MDRTRDELRAKLSNILHTTDGYSTISLVLGNKAHQTDRNKQYHGVR